MKAHDRADLAAPTNEYPTPTRFKDFGKEFNGLI